MKKIQSLGKTLTKEEQRQVNGGLLTARQGTCGCADGTIEYSCGTNCAQAQTYCTTFNFCSTHGGLDWIGLTCTACM